MMASPTWISQDPAPAKNQVTLPLITSNQDDALFQVSCAPLMNPVMT
jgi:hypothetical protein